MVDLREEDLLFVDIVANALDNLVIGGLELVSGVDTARDGAMSVELSLHLVGAFNTVVVMDVVLRELNSLAIGVSSLSSRRRSAVAANVVGCAHTVDQVVGGVLLARRVRDTDGMGISVYHTGVATITGTTSLAVNDGLGIESNWR